MHSTGRSILWTALVLLLLSFANATSVTLSLLQRISGFSSVCADAYNTPLTQCTLNELTNHAPGRACTLECVEQLERISLSINMQCKGTRAYPDTLIGMFFNQTGVTTLCPNVLSGGSGETSEVQSSQSATTASASETIVRTTAQTTQTQASTTRQRSTQASASSTVVVLVSFPSSAVSTSSSFTTSQTQVAEPTLNSAATLTQSQLSGFGSNTANAVSSLTSSSATASASSSQDRDGNRSGSGGTPFDISASSRNAARMSWAIPTMMCLLGAVWLV